MKLLRSISSLTILMVAMYAVAQDGSGTVAGELAGTWSGETSGVGGLAVVPIELTFNADGTGTMATGDTVHELEDVTIDARIVAFSIRPLLGGATPAGFRFHYEGEVEADTLTLSVTMEGRESGGGEELLVLTRKVP